MRLWSIHPRYLDPQGLVALWREALLAQKVLAGETVGYRNHPQLLRFREGSQPLIKIGSYLLSVHAEAETRGYSFDASKIRQRPSRKIKMTVTRGQVEYEFKHLKRKLRKRSPAFLKKIKADEKIELHPLFRTRPGSVEIWEIV